MPRRARRRLLVGIAVGPRSDRLLEGKVVVDPSNPIAFDGQVFGKIVFAP